MPTLAHGSRPRSHRGRRLLSCLLVIALVALLLMTLTARRRVTAGRDTCRSPDFVGGHLGVPQRVAVQHQNQEQQQQQQAALQSGAAADRPAAQRQHKLAVVVSYRDRPEQLDRMLVATADCIRRGTAGLNFDIFIFEQTSRYYFNRGALFNTAALLLEGTDYDHYAFHDVDTVCGEQAIPYAYPAGASPLHLTPPGLHPRDDYPEFLGGNIIFSREQFRAVNGFHHSFWGWGKEDNNMVRRLQLHGMWPPERPQVPPRPKGSYWVHLDHPRQLPVIIADHAERNVEGLVNLEPRIHDDHRTGLAQTRFWVSGIQPYRNATKFTIELHCDRALTSWCERPPSRRTLRLLHPEVDSP